MRDRQILQQYQHIIEAPSKTLIWYKMPSPSPNPTHCISVISLRLPRFELGCIFDCWKCHHKLWEECLSKYLNCNNIFKDDNCVFLPSILPMSSLDLPKIWSFQWLLDLQHLQKLMLDLNLKLFLEAGAWGSGFETVVPHVGNVVWLW